MILIVDSDKSALVSVRQCFDELGLQSINVVQTAAQAREVLDDESLESGKDKITLIVIAAELADDNVNELCREFRNNKITSQSFIVMVISSEQNKTAIESARRSGANGIMVKPYSLANANRYLAPYVQKKAVLLVDDDPLIRQMVKKILSDFDVEVLEVDDGLIANNLLNSMLPPRLVLMDIGLPNFNGIQLVTKIRTMAAWSKTPVVMLTSSTDANDVKKSLASGANDYIAKPFDIGNFRDRVTRYLADGK